MGHVARSTVRITHEGAEQGPRPVPWVLARPGHHTPCASASAKPTDSPLRQQGPEPNSHQYHRKADGRHSGQPRHAPWSTAKALQFGVVYPLRNPPVCFIQEEAVVLKRHVVLLFSMLSRFSAFILLCRCPLCVCRGVIFS